MQWYLMPVHCRRDPYGADAPEERQCNAIIIIVPSRLRLDVNQYATPSINILHYLHQSSRLRLDLKPIHPIRLRRFVFSFSQPAPPTMNAVGVDATFSFDERVA
jgi:hypothetical protein